MSEKGKCKEALIKHRVTLERLHNVVPRWMLEYAVCPKCWVELMKEMEVYELGGREYSVMSEGRKVELMGFTLHYGVIAETVPPLCVFHSLEV